MSLPRLLSMSPSRHSASSSSPTRKARASKTVELDLRVPSYGSVFMPFPNPLPDPDTPRQDKEISGDLEVEIPPGFGRQRCHVIRVGIRTTCRLTIPERGLEEDVIYEGKVEVRGGTSEGVVLEEGLQRFSFTLIIPGNLATHDFHPGHRVDNTLFAEIEGRDDSAFSWLRRSTLGSSSRGTSPSSSLRTRSSPSSSPNMMSPSLGLSILRQESALPEPPTYDLATGIEGAEAVSEIPWLVGNHRVQRPLILLYNPDPAGGVSSLDVRVDGYAQGLGPYTISFLSDEWCIAAQLKAKMILQAPSPKVTVFYVAIALCQTANVTSPRDGVKTVNERVFPIGSHGQRPSRLTLRPDHTHQAIWRGKEASGEDREELAVDGEGRLPNDYEGRPSTLQGVETPINVSHALRTEVWYSVEGEDVEGQPLQGGGPGVLRMLRVDKEVIVPACFFIPEVLDLPSYGCGGVSSGYTDIQGGRVCPLCKTPSTEQFCKTCPLTTIPHPRHDHPKKLVGTSNGFCPSCCTRIIPSGRGEWRDCACGMLRQDIITRMKRINIEELVEVQNEEEQRDIRDREEKVEAERGRSRARD